MGGVPAAWVSVRVLARSQRRTQPLQVAATVAAIALGVALAFAVYLINSAALGEFDRATRRMVGGADLIVRGGAGGFDEALFVQLARDPAVSLASPLIELQLEVPDHHMPLPLIALDPVRAGDPQRELVAGLSGAGTRVFAHGAVVLSHAAAEQLGAQPGAMLPVVVGSRIVTL